MSAENTLNTASPAATEAPPWSEDPLTARSKMVWTAGDFLQIARGYAAGAADFVTRLNLRPGETVLDVACGTGNLAIPAARAGARVTGIDIAPNLITEAKREARALGLVVDFELGNAESLPYPDRQFETTITMFGAMFAHRPDRAAAELLRVTRSGGRIVMANWTKEGVIGTMLRAHTAVVPPPAGIPSPLTWGDEDTVRARFGAGVTSVGFTRRIIELRFPLSPAAVAELFATYYGPTVITLKAADPDGASRLREDLKRIFTDHNPATDGTTIIPGEYLEVEARVA